MDGGPTAVTVEIKLWFQISLVHCGRCLSCSKLHSDRYPLLHNFVGRSPRFVTVKHQLVGDLLEVKNKLL